MKVFICLAILVAAVCAAPFEGGASGSQAGANAATQTFQQGGGGFYPHGAGFAPFGASGSQAGATAQTQSFHQGGGGGFGPHHGGHGPTPYGFAPPSFGASAAQAGASTQTFQQGGHGGGASGSQAAATAQTQSFHS